MELIIQVADLLGPLGLLVAVLVYLLLNRRINRRTNAPSSDREVHQKLFAEIKTLASTANHTQSEIKTELSHLNTRLDLIGTDLSDLRRIVITHLEKHAHA